MMRAVKREDSIQIDEKGIIKILKELGHDAWRNHNGTARSHKMRFGRLGISDVIGMHRDGKLIAIERKRHGEEISEAQIEFLIRCHDAGAYAGVATCAVDVIDILSGDLILGK